MDLIVHHWDTDGICSAAIVAGILEEKNRGWTNVSPPPGVFEFDDRIWRAAKEADHVYVVDLNMPSAVENLHNERVVFIDHHVQRRIMKDNVVQVNPVLKDRPGPSATWVVSDYYDRWNRLSAMGVVGDLGRRAFELSRIDTLLDGVSMEEALRLSELIYSSSVAGDRSGVERAVEKVRDSDLRALLDDGEWNRNLQRIQEEREEVIASRRSWRGVARVEFSSEYNIISGVARELVWEQGYEAGLVVNEGYGEYGQAYLRVDEEEAEQYGIPGLIECLRERGFNAGGKVDVVGVICGLEDLDRVVSIIENHLGER